MKPLMAQNTVKLTVMNLGTLQKNWISYAYRKHIVAQKTWKMWPYLATHASTLTGLKVEIIDILGESF